MFGWRGGDHNKPGDPIVEPGEVVPVADAPRFLLSRRRVLWLLPGIAAFTSRLPASPLTGSTANVSVLASSDQANGIIDLQYRRTADFALIRFRFLNARWKNRRTIEARDRSKPLLVAAWFAPQHLQEQAIPVSNPWSGPPVWCAFSGRSRIGFDIPGGILNVSDRAILQWQRWRERRVDPLLPIANMSEPRIDETAIELPTGLSLSPDPTSDWVPSASGDGPLEINVAYGAGGNVSHASRTELWHVSLLSKVQRDLIRRHDPKKISSLEKPMIRAVWSNDRVQPPHGVDVALTAQDRRDIVYLSHSDEYFQSASSDAIYDAGKDSRIATDALALSAMGGWLNLRKYWDTSPFQNVTTQLSAWTNRTELGRDSFVQKQYLAYLYPLGFHVIVVVTTYRDFEVAAGSTLGVALLRQDVRISFRDRAISNQDPHLVFTEVSAQVAETPIIVEKFLSSSNSIFWPCVPGTGTPYEFAFTTTDAAGNAQQFTAPQLVVYELALESNTGATLQLLEDEYYRGPWSTLRRRPFGGRPVSFVSNALSPTDRSATLPVLDLLLAASRDYNWSGVNAQQIQAKAPFTPFLDSLHVALAGGFVVRSSTDLPVPQGPQQTTWCRPYCPNGPLVANPRPFSNPNNVFLVRDPAQFGNLTQEIQISYDARAAGIGGLALPNITVGGFGVTGPFGWAPGTWANPLPAAAATDPRPPYDPGIVPIPIFPTGLLNPADYFTNLVEGVAQSSVLLGVQLNALLAIINNGPSGAAPIDVLPVFKTTADDSGTTYSFSWITSAFAAGGPASTLVTHADSILRMSAVMNVGSTGQVSDFSASGELTDFAINLNLGTVGAISFAFQSITFTQQGAGTPTFSLSPPAVSLS
jgi:hypothetical protein